MKITFLSRGMNRVLGLTVMVFLPGIFFSVRLEFSGAADFADCSKTLFSSNFFEFSDVDGIKVAGTFWIFWAIMIPVSTVIFGALVISTTSFRYRPLAFIGLIDDTMRRRRRRTGSKPTENIEVQMATATTI